METRVGGAAPKLTKKDRGIASCAIILRSHVCIYMYSPQYMYVSGITSILIREHIMFSLYHLTYIMSQSFN